MGEDRSDLAFLRLLLLTLHAGLGIESGGLLHELVEGPLAVEDHLVTEGSLRIDGVDGDDGLRKDLCLDTCQNTEFGYECAILFGDGMIGSVEPAKAPDPSGITLTRLRQSLKRSASRSSIST